VYFDDPVAQNIAKEAVRENKILAAICIAPVILANAGVLRNKKATVFPSEKETLINAGAQYTGKDVEVDGNIITASGPQAAEKFAATIKSSIINKK
jgi:protease I